jgi:hypothetical protein
MGFHSACSSGQVDSTKWLESVRLKKRKNIGWNPEGSHCFSVEKAPNRFGLGENFFISVKSDEAFEARAMVTSNPSATRHHIGQECRIFVIDLMTKDYPLIPLSEFWRRDTEPMCFGHFLDPADIHNVIHMTEVVDIVLSDR